MEASIANEVDKKNEFIDDTIEVDETSPRVWTLNKL